MYLCFEIAITSSCSLLLGKDLTEYNRKLTEGRVFVTWTIGSLKLSLSSVAYRGTFGLKGHVLSRK